MNIDNEQCPKCESYKLTKVGKGATFLILIATGSVLFWVGIFIWPLLPIAFLLMAASPVAFFVNKRVTCEGCGYQWEIDRKTGEVITDVKQRKVKN